MGIETCAEDLLARVAQQDVNALSELYDQYAPRLFALIVRILPLRELAENVLQEVFVRLWSEGASLRQEGGSVAAWLVVTARDLAVERLRALRANEPARDTAGSGSSGAMGSNSGTRKFKSALLPATEKLLGGKLETSKPRSAHAVQTPAEGSIPTGWLPKPKEVTRIDDRLALLHKAIDQLPKSQRQALDLAVFGGLSESEIAAKTGEPLGKVQRSLRAALTFVKQRRRAVCGTWAANI
jgi:RNA polymerase sigma-70 factor, ECF subfamily